MGSLATQGTALPALPCRSGGTHPCQDVGTLAKPASSAEQSRGVGAEAHKEKLQDGMRHSPCLRLQWCLPQLPQATMQQRGQ